MSQHKFKIYRFQPYNQDDSHFHITHISSNSQPTLQMSYNSGRPTPSSHIDSIPPWIPSQRLRKLHTQFQNTTLCQYICIPCAFCGRLLYPTKAKWVPYDEDYTYPLEVNFQNISVYIRGEGSTRTICICDSCKTNKKRYPCPRLHPIPNVIKVIPIAQRRFLSPVFLHCSLGRNLNANKYTEYRSLVGDMEFSKNMRALNFTLVYWEHS